MGKFPTWIKHRHWH